MAANRELLRIWAVCGGCCLRFSNNRRKPAPPPSPHPPLGARVSRNLASSAIVPIGNQKHSKMMSSRSRSRAPARGPVSLQVAFDHVCDRLGCDKPRVAFTLTGSCPDKKCSKGHSPQIKATDRAAFCKRADGITEAF